MQIYSYLHLGNLHILQKVGDSLLHIAYQEGPFLSGIKGILAENELHRFSLNIFEKLNC